MALNALFRLVLLAAALLPGVTPAGVTGRSGTNVERRQAGPLPSGKYFREPGRTLALSHYDSRFFQREISYGEHSLVLRNLIRSYLSIMRARGVETWIAHGTLLGWWWNGRIMPWDYDLDVQVTNTTMAWLAANLNNTRHVFEDESDSSRQGKNTTYLVDVNPHYAERTRGDGMNIIDARWIDTDNGMFIDITVLRERDDARPGVWSCKNSHRYSTHDLWPLRVTEFEDVVARVPYNFESILSDEYGPQSLVLERYAHHTWDRDIQAWVKESPDEQEKSRATATEKKIEELRQQGRLAPE